MPGSRRHQVQGLQGCLCGQPAKRRMDREHPSRPLRIAPVGGQMNGRFSDLIEVLPFDVVVAGNP
jgi:hypothetical protein